jgi:hypothetical protein
MLPNGTEPLILADGTRIDPEQGTVIKDEILVAVPNTAEIKRDIIAAKRRLHDLPVPPKQMNTLSVILSYSLCGISDNDISTVLSLSSDQVVNIKQSDAYKEIQTIMVNNITESDSSSVRDMFVQHSQGAAQVMFDVMANPDVGVTTKMVAAKDVLDRAGQRPVDVVEHRHKMEGGLTIEYVEKKDDIPTIDITPEEF